MADHHEDDPPPNKRPKMFQGLSTSEFTNPQDMRDGETDIPDVLIGRYWPEQYGVVGPIPPTQLTNGGQMSQQQLIWINPTAAAMQRQISNHLIQLDAEPYLSGPVRSQSQTATQTTAPPSQLHQPHAPHQPPAFSTIIDFEKQKQIQQQLILATVPKNETELVELAADKIQQQAELSSDIKSLQEQLKKVIGQLESVKCEKKLILASIGSPSPVAAGAAAVAELMDNELQCSVCAELFVGATTLNCSHTFCHYCITKWKMKKKDCPICRTAITYECKSIVIDSFIEKVVLSLSDDMKKKRQEMLKAREELEIELARRQSVGSSRGSNSYVETDANTDSEFIEEDEEEDTNNRPPWPVRRSVFDNSSDADSEAEEPAASGDGNGNTPVSNNTERRAGGDGGAVSLRDLYDCDTRSCDNSGLPIITYRNSTGLSHLYRYPH